MTRRARAAYALLISLTAFLSITEFSSCSKSTNNPAAPVVQGPSGGTGIGPAGGVVRSGDNAVTLNVPPGALAANVAISIQASADTMPSGVGTVYTFAPEGTQFQIPATLTLHYADSLLAGTSPLALGVGYRTSGGQWMSAANGRVDTLAKTVSVPITHFSQWGTYASYRLDKSDVVLLAGNVITLRVLRFGNPAIDTVGGQPISLPTTLVANAWYVNGDPVGNSDIGTINPIINDAQYVAPSRTPEQNPVAIDAQVILEDLSMLDLRCNVTVLSEVWSLVYHRVFGWQCGPTNQFVSWTLEDSCEVRFQLDNNFQVSTFLVDQLGSSLTNVAGCVQGYTAQMQEGNQSKFNSVSGGYDKGTKFLWFNVDLNEADLPGLTVYANGVLIAHTNPTPGNHGGGRQPYPPSRTFVRTSSAGGSGQSSFLQETFELSAQ